MNRPPPPTAFVLMDDARSDGTGRRVLYRDPVEKIVAWSPLEVEPSLRRLREAQAQGYHAAGFLSYEAGYALEPKLAVLAGDREEGSAPLLWFGLFSDAVEITEEELQAFLKEREAPLPPITPLVSRADYEQAFDRVQNAIVAGDIYQANLTFPCRVQTGDDPLAFYRTVRSRAAAGYGALVYTGQHWLLSFSPELFFMLEDGMLTTKPMKGTALRGQSADDDALLIEELKSDPKQRAENLMIVDLLRNDLSRIAEPGSVAVPHLFAVETYPTVHQMVSTVTARLLRGRDAVDVIEALFPCGSITGAPKIRAMEIIHEVEVQPRGPYTGSIGVIEANGNALFNVAIRTICVKDGDQTGVAGLGSGLVVDSIAANEWHECLDKGRFLSSFDTRDVCERG